MTARKRSLEWLALPTVTGALSGATIVFLYFHKVSLEAFASIVVALATLTLAAVTKQSVLKTDEVIHDERDARRITNTLRMMNEYHQAKIQATDQIELTAHVAASNLLIMARQLDDFMALKKEYDANPADETKNRKQYLATVQALTIVGNFYLMALGLLERELLDKRLYMNNFAMTYRAVLPALKTVNGIVKAVPPHTMVRLEKLLAESEAYLASQ